MRVVLLIFFLSSLLINESIAQLSPESSRIDPLLLEKFAESPVQEALILFQAKADLSRSKSLQSKLEKGEFVFETLEKVATESQDQVSVYLKKNEIAFRSFSIVNAIHAKLTVDQIADLQQFAEIKSINANPVTSFPRPTEEREEATARGAIEWGLEMISAPEVWAKGIFGQGVVVGGQDTGYDWEHPALQQKYRGWNGGAADHNYNWHDAIHEISPLHGDSIIDPSNNPCGIDIDIPCDDNQHGTHTMGTMIGSDGENEIGVAPQAQWIAVRNMERGYGSPATYLEGYQWFLAPTDLNDENPQPSMAPHVINNSWSCPTMEGCELNNFGILEEAVNNLKAAGVVVVVSAGNGGSDCSSINTPSAIFENSFSVGATRSNDTIAGFSSRGPVIIDGSNRLKPNISAPGQGVRSAVLNGGYSALSGTSMAGPHVAGVVALIISANPDLAGQVEIIENIIESTAVPKTTDQDCGSIAGSEVPNHTYGFGRIDALAAVNAALLISGTQAIAEVEPLQIFPNPTRDVVQIEIVDGILEQASLKIFSQTGSLLRNLKIDRGNYELDMTGFASGVYVVQVKNGAKVYQGKIVKI